MSTGNAWKDLLWLYFDRFLLISLVTACKFYDDYRYKNGYYARIGGVSHQEFNKLEQEYLVKYIQFSLFVSVESFDSYCQDLSNFYQEKNAQNSE